MIPDNVTLIVKAPNQQIEDQNVECQSSWTVRQLKGHLSEVYPSKPRTDEQKIIYSGQLLDDNIILKDVLRTYESQIAHTMHLVCTPTKRMPEPPPGPQPSTDGLRQRTVPTAAAPAEPTRPETRQNDQNHNVEMANYLNSLAHNYGRVPPYPPHLGAGLPVPPVPSDIASHMVMMQQAYLQYMQHVANMWQASSSAAPPPAAAPAEAPAAPPAPPAPAPAADDDDAHAHDWLDQLYAASRLAILFSLVYLYGSPARLLLVVLLAAAGYLHQMGFFRDLRLQPRAEPEPPQQAPQPPQPQPQPPQQPQQPQQQPQQPPEQQANPTPAAPPADAQQSLLAVTWMIFTSFFASLIPEAN